MRISRTPSRCSPVSSCTRSTPTATRTRIADAEEAGTPYGFLVFDGVVPDDPPELPALYLDPDADGSFGTVEGRVENPAIDRTDPDEPLLRFVDLTTVHIGRARELSLVDGMRAVVETPRGNPLVAVGEVGGHRVGLIGFDLGESDLPLQVAFPLLMSNLTEVLLPEAEGILPSSMRARRVGERCGGSPHRARRG